MGIGRRADISWGLAWLQRRVQVEIVKFDVDSSGGGRNHDGERLWYTMVVSLSELRRDDSKERGRAQGRKRFQLWSDR